MSSSGGFPDIFRVGGAHDAGVNTPSSLRRLHFDASPVSLCPSSSSAFWLCSSFLPPPPLFHPLSLFFALPRPSFFQSLSPPLLIFHLGSALHLFHSHFPPLLLPLRLSGNFFFFWLPFSSALFSPSILSLALPSPPSPPFSFLSLSSRSALSSSSSAPVQP